MLKTSVLVSALCWSFATASAPTGHIYILDPTSTPKRSSTLSPVAARVLLAQHAGVEDYHGDALAQSDVVDAINKYGVQAPLFEEDQRKKIAMVYMEGVSQPEAQYPALDEATHLTISPGPSANSTRGLFLDLVRQLPSKDRLSKQSDESLENWINAHPEVSSTEDRTIYLRIAQKAADFDSALHQATTKGYTVTAIFPPTVELSSVEASSSGQWGTYTLPDVQSPLRKRQAEQPLSAEPRISVTSDASDEKTSRNSTDSVIGILPACFTSLDSCKSLTNGCSGHGECKQKYTDESAGDSPFKNCYVCECKADVTKDETTGGEKTTYWGGPACQKKDVSVQFWLIALFTIGLVATISFAIGQIWSMGSEELPSVIGAGVSGPPRRS